MVTSIQPPLPVDGLGGADFFTWIARACYTCLSCRQVKPRPRSFICSHLTSSRRSIRSGSAGKDGEWKVRQGLGARSERVQSVLIHSSSLFLINAVEHMVLFRTKFGSKKVGRPKSVKKKMCKYHEACDFFIRSFVHALAYSFVRSFVLQEKYLVSHNCIPGFVLTSDQAKKRCDHRSALY